MIHSFRAASRNSTHNVPGIMLGEGKKMQCQEISNALHFYFNLNLPKYIGL